VRALASKARGVRRGDAVLELVDGCVSFGDGPLDLALGVALLLQLGLRVLELALDLLAFRGGLREVARALLQARVQVRDRLGERVARALQGRALLLLVV